ncbi:hypothetical protein ACFSZS_06040 [Seohaeicola zhoushanensis]
MRAGLGGAADKEPPSEGLHQDLERTGLQELAKARIQPLAPAEGDLFGRAGQDQDHHQGGVVARQVGEIARQLEVAEILRLHVDQPP